MRTLHETTEKAFLKAIDKTREESFTVRGWLIRNHYNMKGELVAASHASPTARKLFAVKGKA